MFKTKELEQKIKDLYYLVNLLKEELRVLDLRISDAELEKQYEAELTPLERAKKQKEERIDKSFQELFNYTEKIATRGYDE